MAFAPDLTGRQLREAKLEKLLRQMTGLRADQVLHPAPGPFHTQAEALLRRQQLLQHGGYSQSQLGVFAEEIGEGGKRRFFVDTFAGFVLQNAPDFSPQAFKDFNQNVPNGLTESAQHLYEVILEDRPCWLYFDLEYARSANPEVEPAAVMTAFRETLALFCRDVLGTPIDVLSIVEMDSSTAQKFSNHVLVQHLGPREPATLSGDDGSNTREICQPLQVAFANNAQAGMFVSELLAYANERRHVPGSPASLLFLRGRLGSEQPSSAAIGKEVTLIDESVYSRNRCFRLLFNSKRGKRAVLLLHPNEARRAFGRCECPPLQMLRTMASFVPAGTLLFQHPLIPLGIGHAAAKVSRLPLAPRYIGCCTSRSTSSVPTTAEPGSGLLQHLMITWDNVRRLNEPRSQGSTAWRTTCVQSCVQIDQRFLAVTLSHNRFCFCKGASHHSNHIYLVIDTEDRTFHQKCHDVDCKWFSSPSFTLPGWMLENRNEADLLESLSNHLDQHTRVGPVSDTVQAGPDASNDATDGEGTARKRPRCFAAATG